MLARARIDLLHSWLALDSADRLVYRPGAAHFGVYVALALVLAFLAAMAYPRAPSVPTPDERTAREAIERARRDALGRGARAVPPALPDLRSPGTPASLRPLYYALSAILALGSCTAAACPFRYRTEFRLDRDGRALRVEDRGPFRRRVFHEPLCTQAQVALRCHEHRDRPGDRLWGQDKRLRWTVELLPPAALPVVDIQIAPHSAGPTSPPHKACHLAKRLAEMTGWPLHMLEAQT